MWAAKPGAAQLSRLCIASSARAELLMPARVLGPAMQIRHASMKKSAKTVAATKKKKARPDFKQYNINDAEQFSLCDAMRYIQAFEVGQDGKAIKYEVALKLKTLKNGAVVRNRLRLPVMIVQQTKICVICPPDSKYAQAALAAGAAAVGEQEIFDAVKEGRIEYDTYICQTDSFQKMAKAGLGRILGPRGLMPNPKQGTVVANPSLAIKDMMGASQYRERQGVVRMPVGQLDFTPEELQKNIKAFIDAVKKDFALLSDKIHKDVAEVVLSATHSPGFTLSGLFRDPDGALTSAQLSQR